MATFNRLFIIVGFALCSLAAASASCSAATGECDALDQADDVHVSLLQKGIERDIGSQVVSHGLRNGKTFKTKQHQEKVTSRLENNGNTIKTKKYHATWLGTCRGEGCPPAYNTTCPSECETYPGLTGVCLGISEEGSICPTTFDLAENRFCPKGCTVVPDPTGDVDLIMKSSHKNKTRNDKNKTNGKNRTHRKIKTIVKNRSHDKNRTQDNNKTDVKDCKNKTDMKEGNNKTDVKEAWLGTCSGVGCPSAYTADKPCPSECTAVAGTAGTCSGTDDKNNACSGTFDLDADEPCKKGCTATPDGGDSTAATAATTAAPVATAAPPAADDGADGGGSGMDGM
jgi:hypothetical protein